MYCFRSKEFYQAADSSERQRFSKTNYRRDYKQHRLAGGLAARQISWSCIATASSRGLTSSPGLDIKGDIDKAFDKAVEKASPPARRACQRNYLKCTCEYLQMTPRQPRPQLPFWKDEGSTSHVPPAWG